MIVEHNEDERDVLSLILENEVYIVHMAAEEGLALEELKRRRFDVVICAHHMPYIDGFRLALLVRLVWPGLPMILLLGEETSLSDAAGQRRAYGSLRKPYDFGELLELIRNAIRLTREPRAQAWIASAVD